MKCKKIAAMIVASATFMAFATSGFAASVTTTTTYNQFSDKVVVNVDVAGAQADKEVTYLVKSKDTGNKIVYIDQKTAATNGSVNFNYKVAKSDITELGATVQFGTDGTEAITGYGDIQFTTPSVTHPNANITFYSDKNCTNEISGTLALGTNETVYAKVVPATNYEVKAVKVNDVTVEATTGGVYTIENATTIVVETSEKQVAPGVETPADITYNEDIKTPEGGSITIGGETFNNVITKTTILKVVGAPKEVGVTYNGINYPAFNMDGGKFNTTDGLCAVKIVAPAGTTIEVTPYHIDN